MSKVFVVSCGFHTVLNRNIRAETAEEALAIAQRDVDNNGLTDDWESCDGYYCGMRNDMLLQVEDEFEVKDAR